MTGQRYTVNCYYIGPLCLTAGERVEVGLTAKRTGSTAVQKTSHVTDWLTVVVMAMAIVALALPAGLTSLAAALFPHDAAG